MNETITETAETAVAQPLDMAVSVRLIEPKGKLLGFANVTLNNDGNGLQSLTTLWEGCQNRSATSRRALPTR